MGDTQGDAAQSLGRVRLGDPTDCNPPGSSVHGMSRQKHCSGWPLPLPGDLPDPGTEPRSPTLQADSLPSEPPVKPVKLDKDFLKSYFNVLKNLKRKHEQNEDRNEKLALM